MDLTLFKRPNRSDEEIIEHKAIKLAADVARKLEGISELKIPKYFGSTYFDHARHRELEINIRTDLGWGDPLAFSLMRHHANEAVISLKSFAENWTINTQKGGPGGWNNLAKRVNLFIDSLRSRIDPALYVAEAEFDPHRIFRSEYEKIEKLFISEVSLIAAKNNNHRLGASKYRRSKIRDAERAELQKTINNLLESVSIWKQTLCKISFEV
jgi:hypothetical protein